MSEEKAIEIFGLSKKFSNFVAVDSISFEVKEGELFGFLGPNGAGKTTTTHMLATLLKPTKGTAKVNGFDITREAEKVRKSIGIVFQDNTLDTHLTAFDNLDIHGRMYAMGREERNKKIEEVLGLVELSEWKHKMVKNFSGGMKRRLEIARGLLHEPKILFLDEPTLGLDAQTKRHIWSYIRKLKKQGITILVSTHYLEEADALCDRVAIIDRGKIIALDSPKNLKNMLGGHVLAVKTLEPKKIWELVEKQGIGKNLQIAENIVSFEAEDGHKIVAKMLSLAEKQKIPVESVEFHAPSLEDVFIKFTGERMRKEKPEGSDFKRRLKKHGY